MQINNDRDDDGNRFYKSFAGSVRVSGKVEVEDFVSTFRENDSIEDDQEKFANIQLEFEEYNENEENQSFPAALSTDEEESTINLPSFASLNLNLPKDEEIPTEIIVPISRGDSNIVPFSFFFFSYFYFSF